MPIWPPSPCSRRTAARSVWTRTSDGSRTEVSCAAISASVRWASTRRASSSACVRRSIREPLGLAQVADRAVGADELAAALAADGVDLGRDRLALAPAEHESDPAHPRSGSAIEPGPRLLRRRPSTRAPTIGRPCLADQLLGPPTGERRRRRGERIVKLPVGIGLPHEVGRRDDEVAESRLGAVERPRRAARWRWRWPPWSARPWSSSSSSSPNRCGSANETASVPITSPSEPRSGAAAMPRRPRRSATDWSSSLVRNARIDR